METSELPDFHPTMVRFKEMSLEELRIVVDEISIPLWCDLKKRIQLTIEDKALFPSHYGAI